MKFVFLINSFGAGGAERSLVEALPHLANRGIETVVVTLQQEDVGFESEVRGAGYDIRTLTTSHRFSQIIKFRSLVRGERPSLVYTALFDADLVGRLACVGLPVTVVSNLVNTAYDPVRLEDPNIKEGRLKFVQAVDGFTARHLTDHFHAISNATKISAVEHLRIDPEKVSVIPRGRDLVRLGEPSPQRRARGRAELRVADDVPVLVSVGRQEYQKGHKTLIESFASVVQSNPTTRLFIVGRQGNSTAELLELVSASGVESQITFLGHRDDVAGVLAAADVFVFPSLYEGLGGAVIEAMALGLAIVASDLPAIREVVVEGENAILTPPGRSEPLARAILDLLSDGVRRERFGRRSRSLFEERFAGDHNIVRLIELLESIAERAPGQPTHTAGG